MEQNLLLPSEFSTYWIKMPHVIAHCCRLSNSLVVLYLQEETANDSRDNTAANLLGGNLSLVHRHDGAGNTDAQAGNNTTGTQHANVLRRALDDGANDPEHA